MGITPLDIYRQTPKTNCGDCGHATCLAFAAKVRAGELEPADCPPLEREEYARNWDAVNGILQKAGWRPLDA